MLQRGSRFLLAAMLVSALLLSAGCGGGQDTAELTEIVIAIPTDATTMDPLVQSSTRDGAILRNMFDTLLKIENDGSFTPQLAVSVEQESPTAWLIELREGVTFSNGEPVNAEAVKFTLDMIQDPENKSPQLSHYKGFSSIEVTDDLKLKIETASPDSLFKVRLANLMILPPNYYRENGGEHFATNPVGSGAYTLETWVKDSHITMETNGDYWQGDPPYDVVTWRVVPEEGSRIADLQTGTAQIVLNLSPDQATALDGTGDFQVQAAATSRLMTVAFNINEWPGDQLAFRQAVALAIDVEAIVEHVLSGVGGTIAPSVLSPVIPNFPKDAVDPFEYNPERARQILAENGLENISIEFETTNNHFPQDRQVAEAIAGQLADVGIDATVIPLEYGVFFQNWRNAEESPAYLAGHGNIWWDPEPQLKAFFQTGGILSSYGDEELDALIAEASAKSDLVERSAAFGEVLQAIHDQVAAVPLYAVNFIYGVSNEVEWEPRSDALIYVMDMEPTSK